MKLQKILVAIHTPIQQFRNKTVLDEKLKETPSPSRKELIKIAESVKPFLNNIKIKTSEFGEEIINRDNN